MKNNYQIHDDVLTIFIKSIPYMFDAADFSILSRHTWGLDKDGYARTSQTKKAPTNTTAKTIYAHRLLLDFPTQSIDHIDGDILNNRRINLREVTHQHNQHNRHLKGRRTNKGYRVRDYGSGRLRYIAQIRVNTKSLHLGAFDTEVEARAAYLAAKNIYHLS